VILNRTRAITELGMESSRTFITSIDGPIYKPELVSQRMTLFKTFNPLVPCGNLGLEGFGLRPYSSPLVYSEINSLSSLNSHI
jgi:hypothetical protein